MKKNPYCEDDFSTKFKKNSTEFCERNRRWIVLLDDEMSIRKVVGDYLYDEGYQVTACSDTTALLQVISLPLSSSSLGLVLSNTNSNNNYEDNNKIENDKMNNNNNTHYFFPSLPDVIISDIRMAKAYQEGFEGGKKDGLDLVRHIRSTPRLQRIPIILLTAKPFTRDRIEGYNAGADVYITKPFDPEELVAIIDNLIIRKQQMITMSSSSMLTGRQQSSRISTKARLMPLLGDVQNIKQLLKMYSKTSNVVQETDVYLTSKERMVLEPICDGYTNKEISQKMNIPVPTVAAILHSIYDKTELHKKSQLVKWSIRTGYIPKQPNTTNKQSNIAKSKIMSLFKPPSQQQQRKEGQQ
eukprot:CAMPEP_0194198530 /NCGR_PEP_ID=MMETSP0154-20130528/77815_1 /TAXON_ID=1049557 /ORGANISM="Thalassiothrix antarctica, Strain L6-D1" /LENGTH=354 /DNA_ID=CAMNT_0038923331 /DNA_START=256 /DNA_END=1320 /DNA_ORIENTATION=-